MEEIINRLRLDKSQWQLTKFGDVAIQQKQSVDRDNTGLTRYVKGEHMGSEDLHLRVWGELTDEYLGPAFIRKFEEGDILYGSRRTYLRKVVVAPFEGITSNTTFVIKANEKKIDKSLLPFIMLSEGFAEHSIRNSKGSVNPYINWKDIANYEFLLPPKDQQAQLAELLWALDEVVEKERGVLEKSIICRYVFFENKLSKSINEVRTLGYVINDIVAGKSPMGQNRPAFNDEYGVLKVSAVGKEEFVDSENKALVDQSEFNMRYEVKPGYILVTRANALFEGIGRACMVKKTRNGLMLSDKTLRIIPNNEYVLDRFLYQCLLSRPFRSYVESVAGGTEAKNISQDNLRNAPIWKPSIQIQSEIVKKLEAFDNVILDKQVQILHSRALQKSLINEIF